MATATTPNPVNLYQLGLELGGGIGFRCVGPDPDGITTVNTDDVDQAALEAAIAAHVADPAIVPPSAVEPEPVDVAAVLAAAQAHTDAARAAVAGMSETSNTRKATEANADALDLLATLITPTET